MLDQKIGVGTKARITIISEEKSFTTVVVIDDLAQEGQESISLASPIAKALLGKKQGDATRYFVGSQTFKVKVETVY